MSRPLGLALLAALLVAVLLSLSAGPALANHVQCGDVITQDTTLDSDLIDCPGDGIVIGAPNITLDLNGHTIDGAFYPGSQYLFPSGVLNQGHANVTIENGTLTHFYWGIHFTNGYTTDIGGWPPRITGAHEATVKRLTVTRSGTAIDITGEQNLLEDNRLEQGIRVNGDGSLIERNVAGEISADGGGNLMEHNVAGTLVVRDGTSNRLEHNVGSMIVYAFGTVIRENRGIRLLNVIGDYNIIEDNAAARRGIWFFTRSTHNQVRNNSIVESPYTAMLFYDSDSNLVENNRVLHPGESGIALAGSSDDNDILHNDVTEAFDNSEDVKYGAFDGSGIVVLGSNDNRIKGNTVFGNAADGIAVDRDATGTVLAENAANGNGDDGINVESAATTLTANLANRNVDLGIDAVPGVTDGGGNRAFHNGNPLQCLNVVCKTNGPRPK
jgi:large repetitive protein